MTEDKDVIDGLQEVKEILGENGYQIAEAEFEFDADEGIHQFHVEFDLIME